MTVRTLISYFFVVCLTSATIIPSSYYIKNVPWRKQITEYSCGAGSLNMVLDFYKPDMDQRYICNVARTATVGTLSYDLVRTAHFSVLSRSDGKLFPEFQLEAGFPGRKYGFAAFSFYGVQWFEELKQLIALNIPVIVLTQYKVKHDSGHYRVVVGYDDTTRTVHMNDPWGREGTPEVVSWSYSDFLTAWQYIEHDSPLGKPYYGMMMQPWIISLSYECLSKTQLKVNAIVEYPCYAPFDCQQYPALNTLIRLDLPNSLVVHTNSSTPINPPTVEQSVQNLGLLAGGTKKYASWLVDILNNEPQSTNVFVTAYGVVQNRLPATPYANGTFYAAYTYTDVIGGEQQLEIQL